MVSFLYGFLPDCWCTRIPDTSVCVIGMATGKIHLFRVCLGGDNTAIGSPRSKHLVVPSTVANCSSYSSGDVMNSSALILGTLTGVDNLRDLSMDGTQKSFQSLGTSLWVFGPGVFHSIECDSYMVKHIYSSVSALGQIWLFMVHLSSLSVHAQHLFIY